VTSYYNRENVCTAEYRQCRAALGASCRACDRDINKGDWMVTMFSFRNRGQSIHICPGCVRKMYSLSIARSDDE
jgi:hypothetical protein